MKMAQLMAAVLALPLDQKETFQVVLGHSIKSDNQTNALVQEELEEATIVVASMPELKSKRSGAPPDPNSVFSLAYKRIQDKGEINQEKLIEFVSEKKGWDRFRVLNNLVSLKRRFREQHGIMVQGRGNSAVWAVETSSAN